MSDQTNDAANSQNESPNLEHLRKEAAEAAELRKANRDLQKRIAFTDAKIPVEEGTPGALLFQTFDPEGDITPDSVLEAAQRFGITPGSSTPPPQGEQQQGDAPKDTTPPAQQQAERQFFEQTQSLNQGDTPNGDVDPNKAALDRFDERQREGSTRQDAAAAGFSELFAGAAKGDGRVIYNQDQWREQHS